MLVFRKICKHTKWMIRWKLLEEIRKDKESEYFSEKKKVISEVGTFIWLVEDGAFHSQKVIVYSQWNWWRKFSHSFFFFLPLKHFFVFLLHNSFHATGSFLHPQKTSENQRSSDILRGYRKRSVACISFYPRNWTFFLLTKHA